MTVLGVRGALAALGVMGLVAVVLVANNATGGPEAVASAAPSSGSLSGSVTEGATAAANVCVYASAKDAPLAYDATTDVAGSYDFATVEAGQYEVFFDPTCKGSQASTYAAQYYDDVPDLASVTWVTVPAGGSASTIDADLQLAGTISGVVSGSGGALEGVCVIAYSSVSGGEVGAATTAANGAYSLSLAPDGYLLKFDPSCRAVNTYAPQYYNDAPDAYAATRSSANVVDLAAGSTQTIDAILQPGSTVEGSVVASGATSSAGTCVFAYDAGDAQIGGVVTDASGSYQLTALASQAYTVIFDPTCNGGQPSDFATETYGLVDPQVGQTIADVNGTLGLAACLAAPDVTSTSLPTGSVSSPYSATLQASGGTGPYTWAAVGLPSGLTLDAATGVISGTPSAAFSSSVTVTATDSSEQPLASAPRQLGLSITPATTTTTSATTTTTSSTTTSNTTTSSTTSSSTTSSSTTSTTVAGCSGGGGGPVLPMAPVIPVVPAATTSTTTATSTTTGPQTTTTARPLPVLPPGAPHGTYASPVTATVTSGPTALSDEAGDASADLSVPAGALPVGTTLSIAAVKNVAALMSEVPAGQTYLTSFAVSWAAVDGTSPTASRPITMTIADPAIRAGDTIYILTSTGIRAVGTATTNGYATVTFTNDPAFVVAAVPRLGTVAHEGALKGSRVQLAVACAAGTRCSGLASLEVAVGKAGAKRNVLFAAGHFTLSAGRAGALSLPISGAARQLLRSAAGKGPQLAGNLTVALLGGKKSQHRVSLRLAHPAGAS